MPPDMNTLKMTRGTLSSERQPSETLGAANDKALASQYNGSGRRPRVDEPLTQRIDAQIEAFQRAGAQQYEVAGIPKHDLIGCRPAGSIDEGRSCPALQHGSIGLAKSPLIAPLDLQ